MDEKISLNYLGQSGIFCESNSFSFMIDPYLSNSVEELEGNDLKEKFQFLLSQINFLILTGSLLHTFI